jgi:hypothetical protein
MSASKARHVCRTVRIDRAAVGINVSEFVRHMYGEARFADATRAGQGQEPHIALKQRAYLSHLTRPPNEWGQR